MLRVSVNYAVILNQDGTSAYSFLHLPLRAQLGTDHRPRERIGVLEFIGLHVLAERIDVLGLKFAILRQSERSNCRVTILSFIYSIIGLDLIILCQKRRGRILVHIEEASVDDCVDQVLF